VGTYKTGEIPAELRDKGIPEKFTDAFVSTYNKVLDDTKSDEKAGAQAYGGLNMSLYNSGFRLSRDGTWKKVSAKEAQETEFESFTMRAPTLEGVTLEEALENGLDVPGIALIDHAVSQLGTGGERYYSPEYCSQVLQRSLEYMDLGHNITGYNKHGSAMGGFLSMSTTSPDARVTELKRDGANIVYTMHISPTSEGKDMIIRLFDRLIEETSVRIYDVKGDYVEVKDELGGKRSMWVPRDGYIGGIDFCDEAGVTGAGVVRVESMEVIKENEMEYSDITLEALRENRADLVGQIVTTELGTISTLVAETKAERDEARAELAKVDKELPTKFEAAEAKLVDMAETLDRVNRVVENTPIAKELLAKTAELTAEEFTAGFAEHLEAAVEALVTEYHPEGKGHSSDDDPDLGDKGYEEPDSTDQPNRFLENLAALNRSK